MTLILGITAGYIFLYLIYPVWLSWVAPGKPQDECGTAEIKCVSVILLSFNGRKYLKEKIEFLLRELSAFDCYELIIIDDHSTDGSVELLNNFTGTAHIQVLFNDRQNGIPYAMNLGVSVAENEYLVFFDQRQELSPGILKRIVEPLKFENVGAVSGCISSMDKEKKRSVLRTHENFLKAKESNAGSLIGVYGPFYAIKKECYSTIPDNIILDDLYLSLRILKTKQIVIRRDCEIFDDDFDMLYDLRRTKKYLSGFLQILNQKSIIRDLTKRQQVMLIWHKYMRLLIPVLVFLCYITSAMMIFHGVKYLVLFSILTVVGLLSLMPLKINCLFKMKNIIRLNFFYFIAIADFLGHYLLFMGVKKPPGH